MSTIIQCYGQTKLNKRCRKRVRGGLYCHFHITQNESTPISNNIQQNKSSISNTVNKSTLSNTLEPIELKQISHNAQQIECTICCNFTNDIITLDCCKQQLCNKCLNKLAKTTCPYCRSDLSHLIKSPARYLPDEDTLLLEHFIEILYIYEQLQYEII